MSFFLFVLCIVCGWFMLSLPNLIEAGPLHITPDRVRSSLKLAALESVLVFALWKDSNFDARTLTAAVLWGSAFIWCIWIINRTTQYITITKGVATMLFCCNLLVIVGGGLLNFG